MLKYTFVMDTVSRENLVILKRAGIAAWAGFFILFSILFIYFNMTFESNRNSLTKSDFSGPLQSLIEEEIEEKVSIEEVVHTREVEYLERNNYYSPEDSTHSGYAKPLLRPPSIQSFY